jgi:tetratricopeptide (TPR) repeat protein
MSSPASTVDTFLNRLGTLPRMGVVRQVSGIHFDPHSCASDVLLQVRKNTRNRFLFAVTAAILLLASCPSGSSQSTEMPRAQQPSLQGQYQAAETSLEKRNLEQAKIQFELFLADALHRVANGRAQAGKYPEAVALYEQALAFAPSDSALTMDYATAALDARDFPKTRRLAEQALALLAKNFKQNSDDARAARLHRLLGQAFLGMDDNNGAREQFTDAVAADPSFANQYALAQACLALLDTESAAKVFASMLAQFGNTAEMHMEVGLAYARADFPEEAIPEFRKVLATNAMLRDAHYSLGAAILGRSGDTAFPEAEVEFHKELTLHPNDFFSYYELGYIAMKLHRLPEAVRDLSRAAELNPRSDDTFLLLGAIYSEMGQSTDEEIALRKAIQACTDPSRNHYQIRGAHYQLGLLLVDEGKTEEGKKELKISQDLLLENRALDAANMSGRPILRDPVQATDSITDPKNLAELSQFEQQVGPAIADSFNNLGAITAQEEDYGAAASYFKQAADWDPTMEGLDYNWGRAAFGARDYRQAVVSLTRYMKAHPDDNRPLVPLGMSQFELSDYAAALHTLAPLGAQLETVPLLAYAYAESLVKTGDTAQGIDRLERLESSAPDLAIVPLALGEAFVRQKDYQNSEAHFRKALSIHPADQAAKLDLALTLIALGRQGEAETLLTELAQSGAQNPAIYFHLGQIQLDRGETDAAIRNLETAASFAPQDNAVRQALEDAHRRAAGAKENK